MKKTISSILFCLCMLTSAQDRLVLKSGDTLNVRVIAIDELKNIIVYVDDLDTIIADLDFVTSKIIVSNASQTIPETLNANAAESFSDYKHKIRFFDDPAGYGYGKFSLNTNLTSLFKFDESLYDKHFGLNSALSIEPEYSVSKTLSIKLPVLIGLNRVEPDGSYLYYTNMFTYYREFQEPQIDPYYFEEDYSYEYPLLHPPNIIFQVGLYTKHFGKNAYKSKNNLYFSQGLSIGRGEYYANNFYIAYELDEYNYYNQVDQRINFSKNEFTYLRYEMMIGLLLKYWKNFNISFESGISTGMTNKGEKEDISYRKIGNGEYLPLHTNVYEKSGNIIMINRINLVYRFGGHRQ